ncbi:hypothetical protein BBK36DRAFT_1168818 [Trichoderma citrinoviride]|uniref:Uncharacterized protein n=1 Tax=Trichoderma citrinoviride TaxID=58853 RepID=A0A2T4BA87_9HYPO|nr:hypothetical protein BBK36DRAFT_1168818 [Trichoderma citrinoviride]PTB66198.1 hypothetical protein BBK36DRAFT_1168818 [Trichoderma citrinoviride]
MADEDARTSIESARGISDLVSKTESNLEVARQLDIIPLRNGSLTSLAAGPHFWPTSAGAPIPADSEIRVVHEAILKHESHGQILKMLGVHQAPIHEVRSLILQQHATLGELTPTACKEHLHLLYLTHNHRHSNDELRDIYILDQKLQLKRPREDVVYLPCRTPFSPEQLLSHTEATNSGVLSCNISLLNPSLLEHPPSVSIGTHFGLATYRYPTWKQWLRDSLGIREHIRLANQTGDNLSDEFAQVSRRKPDIVLKLLAHVWKTQHQIVTGKPDLLSKVRNISVPCRTGDLRPLWETYMPFQHLQRRRLGFMKPHEPFPFLDFGTPPPSTEDLSRRWAFLYIQEANPDGLSSQRCRELARLYCEVEAICAASEEPESARDICRSFIQDINGLAIPPFSGYGPRWMDIKQCSWNTSTSAATKLSLRCVYGDILRCSPRELEVLQVLLSAPKYTA